MVSPYRLYLVRMQQRYPYGMFVIVLIPHAGDVTIWVSHNLLALRFTCIVNHAQIV